MKMSWIAGVCLLALLIVAAAFAEPAADVTNVQAVNAPNADQSGITSLIKVDGRMFVGVFDSGKQGAYPTRALDIPDAKLRLTYTPSKDVTVVTRLDLVKVMNGTAGKELDYFYLDLNNWGGLAPNHTIRLGKMKEDVGDETWTDNPIESILITNSAAHVSGYDAGVDFRGPIPVGVPCGYSMTLLNNTSNPGSASQALGTAAKLNATPIDNLYVSASLYDSGQLPIAAGKGSPAPGLSVANLPSSVPAGTTGWTRRLWEVDARYNYGKFGIKPLIPSSTTPPPFQLAAAYGRLNDQFAGAASDRNASYWFGEGLYNATDKLYVASRYSQVLLNEASVMVDSPVAVTKYNRLSLGVGYHLSLLSDIKAEYTINTTGGATGPEPNLNQVAVGVATKF